MLKKIITLFSAFFVLISCSKSGNLNKNLEELDKIYGKCDNPMRSAEYNNTNKNSRVYKACKAKEMAEGTSLFDLGGSFKDALVGTSSNNSIVGYQNSINQYLWQAALTVIDDYPLKIADNMGGYIETDWIYNEDSIDNRCVIKIQINSQEIVSDGVSSKFICQNKNKDVWTNDGSNYNNEEKQITLKILSEASALSNSKS